MRTSVSWWVFSHCHNVIKLDKLLFTIRLLRWGAFLSPYWRSTPISDSPTLAPSSSGTFSGLCCRTLTKDPSLGHHNCRMKQCWECLFRWVSVIDLEFQVVNKSLLAEKWGSVKTQHSMDWSKVRKVNRKVLFQHQKYNIFFRFLSCTWEKSW